MPHPEKAEIWLTEFGGASGHEQKMQRPAILWKDLSHAGLVIAIPLTSKIHTANFPYACIITPSIKNGLSEESVALVYQIRSLDKKKFLKKLASSKRRILRMLPLF
ncbi:MAG: type II toxin-antitoxin system PemK/MazF family toxin [Candidatus Micrarchaeota archaeon]